MLASVFLTLISLLLGAVTFFDFSPVTFFIQLSLGVAAGLAGFAGLMSVLVRRIRKRGVLPQR